MQTQASRSRQVLETLQAVAKIYGRELTKEAVALYLLDLSSYSEEQVLTSLQRCRKELGRFPLISDVIDRIPGEFPSADEAWSLIPTTEEQSTFWTEEIALVYGDVRDLLQRDEVGARMAFREIYTRMVGEARASGKMPKWMPSFGTDPQQRQVAVEIALTRKRITQEDAQRLLPVSVPSSKRIQLEAPKDLRPVDPMPYIEEIKRKLTEAKE